MKTGYLNCIGGISGDMLLGALVDAGVSLQDLSSALDELDVQGFTLSSVRGRRGGVSGTQVTVHLDERGRRKRRFSEFIDVVGESGLDRTVVERSCGVLRTLSEAERAAHGGSEVDPHLEELGELDTLVDVVGAVVGLEMLRIGRLCCSALPSGSGVVRSAHGAIPALSPAASRVLAMAGAPVVPPPAGVHDAGEMVTPTGAAIATTLAEFAQPALRLERVGYGLGARDSPNYPNALALWVGEGAAPSQVADLSLIETNVDDMSPEILGYAQERLFEIGARDVWLSSIQMKKGRPGVMLSALMPAGLETQAVTLVMRETSTLGVRVRPVARYEAERETVRVETSLGRVRVKVKRIDGVTVAVSPEYEDCRKIAIDGSMPLQEVFRIVQAEASAKLL